MVVKYIRNNWTGPGKCKPNIGRKCGGVEKRGFLSAGARKPEYLNRSETCIYRDADRWDTIGFSGNLEAEKKDK